ncbi:MAG: ZIP family zinc transporter [Actinobacteria bacterium]|nr:MAG: ZIP family zinc transporter [Actinomycetota bacterium]
MGEAFAWGAIGASALLIGSLISYTFGPSRQVIAVVMALGTGVLIGSVSFELTDEALKTRTVAWVSLLMLVGAGLFTAGNWVIDRRGGSERKDPTGRQSDGAPLAIVLGSVLDGIPESFVLGLTVIQGAVSLPLLAGVILSNLPEGMASSSGLRAAGWPRGRVVVMWLLVTLVSALSAAAGFVLLDPASGFTGALVQAFAAGALLAMLADTLLPEAYEVEGVFTGPLVAVGFAVSLALAAV